MSTHGPLSGIKVLDASSILAGPLAAQILGDYGADVIKIEHPTKGDAMRGHGPMKDGVPLWWAELARNKRTFGLNLSEPDGAEVFKKLVATADVVIENFRPGTLERWGIGWETLSEIQPGLILARITGWGQEGPYSDRPGFGTLAEAMSGAMSGAGRLGLLDLADPEALSEALYGAAPAPAAAKPVLPMGSRRQVARLAAKALNPGATAPLPLPEGAPYGAVLVDADSCTSGALMDNEDKPQLNFQEDACLQCGLCANICPEDAITYEARLDLSDAALGQRVLNEEEPFACIECGKLFGVASTVRKVIEKLEGKHPMFADSAAGRLIQMCDTCRINAQYHSADNPFTGGERPKVRTTDDYLSKRRDH